MRNAYDSTSAPLRMSAMAAGTMAACSSDAGEDQRARAQIDETLELLKREMAPQRRPVHAGDRIHQAGECFHNLYVVNAGVYKIVTLSADGREQLVGFKFRGDWFGFDGIPDGRHGCDAVAMDTGEVWALRYEQLMRVGDRPSRVLPRMIEAMSREIAHDRNSLMAVCSLPADARVADFLGYWARSHARCGLRSDQITLRMTRAEIGNHLGLTLESVSRALSKLAQQKLIRFCDKGRRVIDIPDVRALSSFTQGYLADDGTLH